MSIAVASARPALYRSTGLGTRVEILVTDTSAVVAAAAILSRAIERIDNLASRFRGDSEISALNERSGSVVPVSDELFELLEAAVAMADATDGAVDPTVGAAMVGLGYDRDFSLVAGGVGGSLPVSGRVPGWRSLELDRDAKTVWAPAGTLIDLGATAKALTADRIAEEAATTLRCGVLVSLGGDIAVSGEPPEGGFAVGVADVCGDLETTETVAIASGGLATSGIAARRWRLGARTVHHIVDPATGLSAASPWQTVSVAAACCLAENAASTAAVVKGIGAPAWLARLGLPARLVGADGVVRCTPGWPDSPEEPAEPPLRP